MNITHDNYTAIINVSEWRIKQVIDHYNNTCTVWVHITSEDGSEYGMELPNRMSYGETWEDKDVEVFIKNQLKEMG